MKNITLKTILIFASFLIFFSCGAQLKVVLIDTVTYKTTTNEYIHARYYKLSDDSLSFVKLVLPDNSQYTLPQGISASGVRFTNELYTWWTKGKTAFLEKINDQGNWVAVYLDCVETP